MFEYEEKVKQTLQKHYTDIIHQGIHRKDELSSININRECKKRALVLLKQIADELDIDLE